MFEKLFRNDFGNFIYIAEINSENYIIKIRTLSSSKYIPLHVSTITPNFAEGSTVFTFSTDNSVSIFRSLYLNASNTNSYITTNHKTYSLTEIPLTDKERGFLNSTDVTETLLLDEKREENTTLQALTNRINPKLHPYLKIPKVPKPDPLSQSSALDPKFAGFFLD